MEASDIKTLEDLKSSFLAQHTELKGFIAKANDEIKTAGSVSHETKAALEKLSDVVAGVGGLGERIDKMEAKMNRQSIDGVAQTKSYGQMFSESAEYKSMKGGMGSSKASLEIKAVTNVLPGTTSQPLVQDQRIVTPFKLPDRRLTIRDALPVGQTTSNLITYAKELVFTNSAGPQVGGSPTANAENVLKNESDITFELAQAPVITIAHFILVSRQVLDDAPMLQSYIDQRLMYGLKLEEEDELLNGDGQFGNLNGLRNQQTAYDRNVSGDTRIDTIRRAVTQGQISEYEMEVVVLNPRDWEAIELQKDSENRYLIANPVNTMGPRLWGMPVIATNSMPNDNFLVMNANMAAQIWDRMAVTVELSREDSDNFRKNMVTLLAEERLALTVYRPSALIGGEFPQV